MIAAWVVAACVAGCAFSFCAAGILVLRQAYAVYTERYVTRSIQDLGDMFLFVEPRQVLLLNVVALVLLAAFGLWLGGVLVCGLCGGAGFFAPGLAVRALRARRVRRFNAQLVEALQQLANALRAGLTFPQAMAQIGAESPAPLGQEFGLFTREVKLGVAVEVALADLAARVGSDDMQLVASSTNIARALGGNLAEICETIGGTIRERFRLEGRIDSLTSQGKMQGWIVAALPLGVGLFLSGYRPDLMEPMFASAFGYVLVGAIVLLELTGFVLIRRIVAIDV